MKKTSLLIIGALIISLFLGIWVYLFLFGSPNSQKEIFANFGIGERDQVVELIPDSPLSERAVQQVDISGEALRQLTTRPVAGFVTFTASSGPVLRYVEIGTGHIYEIKIATGVEARITGMTIPRVTEATFSSDGRYVSLTSITGYIRDTFVGEINVDEDNIGTINGRNLPPNATDIVLSNGIINYTIVNQEGTTGFSFNIESLKQQEQFFVPFRSIRTIWKPNTTYVYNQTAPLLEGSLYEVKNRNYVAIAPTTFGFSAQINTDFIIFTETNNNTLNSLSLHRNTEKLQPLEILTVPEKCSPDDNLNDIIWCAHDLSTSVNYLEDWYKGDIVSIDSIWRLNLSDGQAVLSLNLLEKSGRSLDVTNLQKASDSLYFINKIDNTLWLYDLSV